MRKDFRIIDIDKAITQRAVISYTEIRPALADHHRIESIIMKRSEDNPRPQLPLEIFRRCYNQLRTDVIIPVPLRKPRKRLP